MERRRLGRTGHESSVAVLGGAACWAATVEEAGEWLRLALDHGVNHLDIAPQYGAAESVVGPHLAAVRDGVASMAADAARWLSRRELLARTVTIKVRYSDFTTITRSHTAPPTRDEAALVARALGLLDKTEAGRRPIRLLGVSVHNLCGQADGADAGRLPFDGML